MLCFSFHKIISRKKRTKMEPLEALRNMQLAVWTEDHKTVEQLIKKGTDVNGGSLSYFHVPLCLAIWKNYNTIVSLLISANADVNKNDWKVKTFVMGKAKRVHVEYKEELKSSRTLFIGNTPLITAARIGNTVYVEQLLNAGACVNKRGQYGCTPLMAACSGGFLSCINILLRAGAYVNVMCNRQSPLISTSLHGYKKCLQALISAGANVNHRDKYGKTSLFYACQKGQDECLRCLIAAGGNVNLKDIHGNTPLFDAAEKGNNGCLKILIQAGAVVNIQNVQRNNPLCLSVYTGKIDCVKTLLDAGANIESPNQFNHTPLMCVPKNNQDIMELLLKFGADINNYPMTGGNTPLKYAVQYERLCCVQSFLQAGADINKSDNYDITCLMEAVKNGNEVIVELLIKNGADLNLSDIENRTALKYAVRQHDDEIVELLLKQGALVNEENDCYGDTALMTAARHGNCACLNFIIFAGADINTHNNEYETAFSIAVACANLNCMKTLLSVGAHVNKGLFSFHHLLESMQRISNPNDQSELVEVLYASGQQVNPLYKKKVELFSSQLQETTLSSFCRKSIRKHLISLDKYSNLYYRIPLIILPNSLKDYLLYNTSLKHTL